MTIKITTPNGGSDSLDFGCAQTPVVATVTGTEVSSGEGKLELKTTTGGTSATKVTVLANGNVGIGTTAPAAKLDVNSGALGTSDGNQLELARLSSTNTNGSYLRIFTERDGAGSNWESAFTRIQQRIDVTDQGYIQFNGASNTYGTSFGIGNTETMRIDSAGLLKFNSGYGSAATAYGCRAWVNFNGTGTVAIRESGNVSSITDNGTANYTVNFAVNMPDINYAWSGGAWNSGGTGRAYVFINNGVADALAVGSIRFRTGSGSNYDVATITLSVFR